MSNATIGSYQFEFNPYFVSWKNKLQTFTQTTYGGKVVQILSSYISGATIMGYLPCPKAYYDADGTLVVPAQWDEMEKFEAAILDIMGYHAKTGNPLPFNFPDVGWSAQVFVTDFNYVHYNSQISAVEYTLQMTVDSGFDDIAAAADSMGLDSIPDGVDYVRTVYNTPTGISSWSTVKQLLQKALKNAGTSIDPKQSDLYTYLDEITAEESGTTTTDSTNGVSSSVINQDASGAHSLFITAVNNATGSNYGESSLISTDKPFSKDTSTSSAIG